MAQQIITLVIQHFLGLQQSIPEQTSLFAEKSLAVIKQILLFMIAAAFISTSFFVAVFEACRQWEMGQIYFSGSFLASIIFVLLGTILGALIPMIKAKEPPALDPKTENHPLFGAFERLAVAYINRWVDEMERPKS